MNTEARDIPSLAITQTRLIPADDLMLLREAAIGLPDTKIEVLKTEGQRYNNLATPRHDSKGKHLVIIVLQVPKDQLLISIKTAVNNFGIIDREFLDLEAAREEKRAKQNSF
jgi:hypothetical protein